MEVLYTTGNSLKEASNKLQTCIWEVEKWYRANRLKVNADKSKIMYIGTRQRLNNVDLDDYPSCMMERDLNELMK